MGDYGPNLVTRPAVFALLKPDGHPCVLAEMYVLEIQGRFTVRPHDGGSLKMISSSLLRIIDFCWARRVEFWELDEQDLVEFSEYLGSARREDGRKVRNVNTIRNIISVCVDFVLWCRKLFGVFDDDDLGAWRLKSGEGHKVLGVRMPRFYPRRVATERKQPISSPLRNALWDAVLAKSQGSRFWNKRRQSFLKARRELMLILLEGTGCRPAELIRLKTADCVGPLSQRTIILPTLKTRKVEDPFRRIPIPEAIAIRLDLFIAGPRRTLLLELGSTGGVAEVDQLVFLDAFSGAPLTIDSLQKDFRRLAVIAAPFQHVCMSMFRHRFITNMIRIHLQAFMSAQGRGERLLLSDADYRSVLARVRAFTGHGSEASLMPYVHLAIEELRAFGNADELNQLRIDLEIAHQTLRWMQQEEVDCQGPLHTEFSRRLLELADSLQRSVSRALKT